MNIFILSATFKVLKTTILFMEYLTYQLNKNFTTPNFCFS